MPLDEDGHQDALQNRLTDDEGAIRMVAGEAHTIKCMTLNEPDHNSDGFPPAGGPWARRPTEAAVDEVNDSEEEAS